MLSFTATEEGLPSQAGRIYTQLPDIAAPGACEKRSPKLEPCIQALVNTLVLKIWLSVLSLGPAFSAEGRRVKNCCRKFKALHLQDRQQQWRPRHGPSQTSLGRSGGRSQMGQVRAGRTGLGAEGMRHAQKPPRCKRCYPATKPSVLQPGPLSQI
ncbi:hypothetical protein Y1Q_0005274 [Alligator mississippiensis]|uniref:Uncharacterized protein n=1 Tax=Alligator mississippiensis TaxID=8496 RepID=A0A151MT86_ALLMI|nr:hypothetical protein Y1Q_0005274 [Alligator mississippiensis]